MEKIECSANISVNGRNQSPLYFCLWKKKEEIEEREREEVFFNHAAVSECLHQVMKN